MIESQTPKGERAAILKPRGRTSHSCTVYKNRYMVIIGGEGELYPEELSIVQAASKKLQMKKKPSKQQNDDDIFVDIDHESASESVSITLQLMLIG